MNEKEIDFILSKEIEITGKDVVTAVTMRGIEIARGTPASKAAITLENIMTGVYGRFGEEESVRELVANAQAKAAEDKEAENASQGEEEADVEQDNGVDKHVLMRMIISRYSSNDETLVRVVGLMDEIAKVNKKNMFFVFDRSMTDLEYTKLSLADHTNLMLSYLGNFILTS